MFAMWLQSDRKENARTMRQTRGFAGIFSESMQHLSALIANFVILHCPRNHFCSTVRSKNCLLQSMLSFTLVTERRGSDVGDLKHLRIYCLDEWWIDSLRSGTCRCPPWRWFVCRWSIQRSFCVLRQFWTLSCKGRWTELVAIVEPSKHTDSICKQQKCQIFHTLCDVIEN